MLHQKYQRKWFQKGGCCDIAAISDKSCSSKLRQSLSYMIPLCSITALLFGLIIAISPDTSNVYAADDNISTLADSPTATLSYSGSLDLSNTGAITSGDNVVISMSSNITVKADLINNYNLQISSNSSSLSGPTTINSTTSEVANANNLADNTWGYSWNNGNYKAIPTANTTIANDGVNSSGSVNYTRTLSFAAKFNKQAEAGHYKAQVTLSLAAAPKSLTTYTLSYNNNNGGGTVPSQQSISNYNDSHTFTINSTTPTRSGYEFAGYATSSGGNVAYQPGGTITLQSSAPSQTLYAKWNQIYTRTLSFDANGGSGAPSSVSCSSTSTSCSVTLPATKPTRTGYDFLGWGTSSTATSASYQPSGSRTLSADATVWAVWKSNGATWSNGFSSGIDNMQDITSGFCKNSSSVPIGSTITLKDSRDDSSYTIRRMEDGNCWMTQNLALVDKDISSTDSDISSGGFTIPASSTTGFWENGVSNAYLSNNTGYYTWCAATAGSCKSATSSGQNAPNSICPKNWKLPTGGNDKEFYTLYAVLGNPSPETFMGSPYNFAYTGYVTVNSFKEPSSSQRGFWWSRTSSGSPDVYNLSVSSSGVNVTYGSNNEAHYGFAVRCVAQY